ncbi:hypothetical protein [Gracilibacillus alcaliphilus]
MRHFHFGSCKWLWHLLTYGK